MPTPVNLRTCPPRPLGAVGPVQDVMSIRGSAGRGGRMPGRAEQGGEVLHAVSMRTSLDHHSGGLRFELSRIRGPPSRKPLYARVGNGHMPIDSANTVPAGIEWVELKVTLGAGQVDAGLAGFALEAESAERRSIWFCERIDAYGGPAMLPLLDRSAILRVRKIQDSPDDSTLKLRGLEGGVEPRLWRQRTRAFGDDARIEGDWVTDRHLVSASLDSRVAGGLIDEVVGAGRPHQVQRLFSDDQLALAAEWLLRLDGLELLGPIRAKKWKKGAGKLDAEVVAELWEIDDGPRFLELSMRVNVNQDPVGTQRRLEQTVRDHGLEIAAGQQTKTTTVLTHLATAVGRHR